MATISSVSNRRHDVSIVKTSGIITKVEKWSETQFSTTTDVSGGGGYIYQGTGFIDATRVRTTTTARTDRHTRVYYRTPEGQTQTLTAYGTDLEVLEGAPIEIAWYRCPGFHDKVAGFLDLSSNRWFLLNDSWAYFLSWLGLSWIDPVYMLKYALILAAITFVCYLIHPYLGIGVGAVLALGYILGMGKVVLGFLFRFPRYCLKSEMNRAGTTLRQEFISAVAAAA